MSRGVERGSVAMKKFRVLQPVSEVLFSHVRLAKAIRKL